MTFRELPYDAAPEARRARAVLAALLKAAGRVLDALALRLMQTDEARAATEPQLEFHALGDAAAPEGALYVNGQLVGRVLGVTRL